jgi:hypothetical protein
MDEDAQADETTADSSNPNSRHSKSFLNPLLEPILGLIHPTALSFPTPPSIHLPTTSALAAIHISAFECLNNIFFSLSSASSQGENALSSDVEAGRRIWEELWKALGAVGSGEGGLGPQEPERRREYWDVAVGVLWGVGMIWKGNLVCSIPQVKDVH